MSSFYSYLVILGQIFHVDPVNEDEQKVWGCHEAPCKLNSDFMNQENIFIITLYNVKYSFPTI